MKSVPNEGFHLCLIYTLPTNVSFPFIIALFANCILNKKCKL